MCQYAACAMGGLISSIGLITGQLWHSMILIIIVGIAVFLSCWGLLIKHRQLIGTGNMAFLMILLPLPLAACIYQWVSGGDPCSQHGDHASAADPVYPDPEQSGASDG